MAKIMNCCLPFRGAIALAFTGFFHRLEHELMVVLDVEKVLDFNQFGMTV